ncbi:nuclear transport factor 2 family protein [Cellulosimicrobium cellulans]|uniref:nuclear transport factor 2 family protein n=1 Tax=Cellulosimicrobium cellulans TaxID=1710 RepID=UPI0036EC259E
MARATSEVLDELYEAFNAADGVVLDRLFHPDAVMVIPGSTQISGTYRGKAAIFEAFARMSQITGGTSRAEVRRVAIDEAGAVVIAVDHAMRHGEPVSAEFADVFTVRDGAVSELRFFPADADQMAYFWRK